MSFKLFQRGLECPLCGSSSGKCKETDTGAVLCMEYTRKERVLGWKFTRLTKDGGGGSWGVWAPYDESLDQETRDRLYAQMQARREERAKLDRERYARMRPAEERDLLYREILGRLPINQADKEDLTGRGLSLEQITRSGFRSVRRGLQVGKYENLAGVLPDGTLNTGDGYLCPILDVNQRLVGFQVRRRDVEPGEGRYRFLTSMTDSNPDGATIHMPNGEWPLAVFQNDIKGQHPSIALVEGVGPKPFILSERMQCLTVGAISGNFPSSPYLFRETLDTLCDRYGSKSIVFYPDAGMLDAKHRSVITKYRRTWDLLEHWGYPYLIAWWNQTTKQIGDIDELQEFDSVKLITREQFEAHLNAFQNEEVDAELDAAEQALLDAAAQYNQVCDTGRIARIVALKNKLCKEHGIRPSQLEEIALTLRRDQASEIEVMADIMQGQFTDIENRALGQVDTGISSGFYDLDAMTGGFQNSDLIIVAGRPAMGKTSFCLGIADHVARNRKLPVAIFSLEMSKEQLGRRLVSTRSRIESNRLRLGRIHQNEWPQLCESIDNLSQAPIWVDDTPGISVAQMRLKARKVQAESGGLGMILVDYLQLLEGGADESRHQEISKTTRALKNLAKEMNLPIVALSQLSRGVESRTNKRPMMSDLRESGEIEQAADLIMMLYREEYYDPDTPDRGLAEVIITKHRNGPTGTVKLLFERQFVEFRNLASRAA